MFGNLFAQLGKIFSKKPALAAFVSAIVAMIFSAAYLKGREAKIMEVAKPVAVVIAARNMETGEAIDASSLKLASVPKRFVQPGAFGKISEAAGRILSVPVLKDTHITPANARRTNDIGGLSGLIPSGHRAVAFGITAGAMAIKFIRPNDMVDVMATFDLGNNTMARRTTLTIVENVRVLAVGDKIADAVNELSENTQRKNIFGSTSLSLSQDSRLLVAVSATPDEARIISFAAESGVLSLAIRPFGDEGTTGRTSPVTISTITGGHDELMPMKKLYREYKGR